MFDKLTENISSIFGKLKGKGLLREEDINSAMREIRIALLEADVALPVVKDFIEKVKTKAIGEEVIKSVSPAQMVVKIVNDVLIETLGKSEESELNLSTTPPAIILFAGLQGSGKTTSSAKIAAFLKKKLGKKILLASLDIYRPAAQKQLEILANQIEVKSLEIIEGQKPLEITKRAIEEAKIGAYDILILDSAGRSHIDEELMKELAQVKSLANPVETLLAVDAMTGQDAVNIAKEFNEKIGITGVVITRMDGDARGGVALSMRFITGKPIKFIGVGEKISEIDYFNAERIAGRILGMGDIVALVEKAKEQINVEDAEKFAQKIQKGIFDLNDYYRQIKQIQKMGGFSSMMSLMPGLSQFKDKVEEAGVDNKIFKKQLAIIDSMTKQERKFPKLLNASRKRRIAKGSGTNVQDINQLLKQFEQMQKAMKQFKGGGLLKKMGMMKNLTKMGGGMPDLSSMPNLPAGMNINDIMKNFKP